MPVCVWRMTKYTHGEELCSSWQLFSPTSVHFVSLTLDSPWKTNTFPAILCHALIVSLVMLTPEWAEMSPARQCWQCVILSRDKNNLGKILMISWQLTATQLRRLNQIWQYKVKHCWFGGGARCELNLWCHKTHKCLWTNQTGGF